jgi:hypothetical protein
LAEAKCSAIEIDTSEGDRKTGFVIVIIRVGETTMSERFSMAIRDGTRANAEKIKRDAIVPPSSR